MCQNWENVAKSVARLWENPLRSPQGGAPLRVIKLIKLVIIHRFAKNNGVPPMGGYSLFYPKVGDSQVRTIPECENVAESQECAGK